MCDNIALICAVCRIGLYSCFRRMCCRGPENVRPNFTVLCLGLTKAGKSSVLSVMSGDDVHKIEPTIGFSIKALVFENCILDVKELGGGDNVRPYWDKYYDGTQGVIYVIKAVITDDEMEINKKEFHRALDDEKLKHHPLMVLVTCTNLPDARTTEEISKLLDLEKESDSRKWIIHGCSVDDRSSIQAGFTQLNTLLIQSFQAENNGGEFDKI